MANRVLSTLQGIPYFHSGIGDNTDLLVRVRQDPDGGWYPVVHKGFYYIGTEERYQYAVKNSVTFTVTATGQVQTVIVTGLTEDVTQLGPVLLWRDGNIRPLQRVSSPLRALRPISFSGAGDVRTGSVPGLLVSLVSHPVTGILLSVPSTGEIISNEEYAYNPRSGQIHIRDQSPPSLWGTYLVDETDNDLLKLEEICRIDKDGKVRTQLQTVYLSTLSAAATHLRPLIRKVTSVGSTTVTGVTVERNVITLPATGGLTSGDIVAVSYYVQDSFTAVPSGTHLVVRFLPTVTGSYTLEWETGCTNWYDTATLASGHINRIQLNPILEARQTGFLYVVDSDEPWPTPVRLRMQVSNFNPLYSPSGCSTLYLSVIVLDGEGEPIPQQPLATVKTGPASGALALAYLTHPVTDGLGQVLYTWTLQGTGLLTFTATVTGTGVSGFLTIMVRDVRDYTGGDRWQLGKLLLHMEETPWRDNLHRLNAFYCYPDGAPFQPPDQLTEWNTTVTFDADRSRFYNLEGQEVEKPVAVSTNRDSIATILIDPAPGDAIRAKVQTPTVGRTRHAQPLRIPETSDPVN